MPDDRERVPPTSRLLLVPALCTLLVPQLRLTGDLLRLSPVTPFEIFWLVPIFGAYFGWRLKGDAEAPRPGSIVSRAALPLAIFVAALLLFRPTSGAMGVVSILSIVLVRRIWPRLNDVLLGYAIAARVPVTLAMLLATLGGWETVYDVAPFSIAAGLLPQLTVWFGFTVVAGTLSAGLWLSFEQWRERGMREPSRSASAH